jgi:predicted outer membrane lipoprotein
MLVMVLDFVWVIGLELIAAFTLTNVMDRTVHDTEETASTVQILAETVALLAVLVTALYYVKKIIHALPFPFMGVQGYKTRVFEFKHLMLVNISLLWSASIQQRLGILRDRYWVH